jgi:hypothetical protein
MTATAQITVWNTKLTELNSTRAALVSASLSTADIDVEIANATNLVAVFTQKKTEADALAQNNIDALSVKNNLITHLGTAYQTGIMSTIVCAATQGGCQCLGCQYAYYSGLGFTDAQIRPLVLK